MSGHTRPDPARLHDAPTDPNTDRPQPVDREPDPPPDGATADPVADHRTADPTVDHGSVDRHGHRAQPVGRQREPEPHAAVADPPADHGTVALGAHHPPNRQTESYDPLGDVDLLDLSEAIADALLPVHRPPQAWLLRVGPAGGGDEYPCWPPSPADGELGFLSLAELGRTPVDALLGFDAPDDWKALGLAFSASASRIDRPELASTPTVLVLLVERNGRAVTLVPRLDFDPLEPVGPTVQPAAEASRPEALLFDLCRRALGLPTPPPDHQPIIWWAQLWLDAVLQEVVAEPGRSWPWPALAELHPLHELLHPDAERGPDGFAGAVRTLVADYDWERVRRVGHGGPCRTASEWMDEGCFSRWTLAALPDVTDLLATLRAMLPADAVQALTAALDRWEVTL